ncbi:MAG TPA: M24 family metallopeptidase, partial [Verrucomicrobiae bacterium]|nr:M24 family metallopeptidase [Verrucomicrobiae bacterium]
MVTRKSRREIEKMRTAGRIVAEVLALVESELRPGVSTAHLDRLAERHIRSSGGIPSFKGYGHKS